ncbi:hypothetical protein DPV78_001055 [Talaromyces pinophilus]|nr:hypothetical protein DPV78_001055 [Talaromyces pinophilus]
MVVSLLEGGRDEGGRDVGFEGGEGRVITARRGNGAEGRVGGYGIEGTHIRDQGVTDIIVNEMEEVVVRGEGKSKGLNVQIYEGLAVGDRG